MDWLPSLDRILPGHWWVLGAVLLMLELAAPGIFFVWLALAAFTLGLIVFVLPLAVPFQLFLFAVLCIVAVFVGKRYVGRLMLGGQDGERLNTGASRLVGRTVVVTAAIRNGSGRVRVGDSEWRATGPDTPEGAQVLIVGAEGTTLTVREISGTWV